MNDTHLHLLVAHFPAIGLVFVAGLTLAASLRADRGLWQAAAASAILVALASVAAMTTGPLAAQLVRASLDARGGDIVTLHEVAGQLTTAAGALLGVLSLHAWLDMGDRGPRARWIRIAMGSTIVLALAAAIWASALGGQIRHLELRANPTPAETLESPLDSTTVGTPEVSTTVN